MNSVIIYSRMNSTRLPGKALMKLGGTELIKRIYQRALLLEADKIIVATSEEPTDDILVQFLEKEKIEYFRGDLNDVALRTIQCIKQNNIDWFIRINGDSPLFPVEEINEALKKTSHKNLDFITNLLPRSFPYGYAVEIFNSESFCGQYQNFTANDNENITSFFYRNNEKFSFETIILNGESYSEKVFLTVDDTASYNFMNNLFNEFPEASRFGLAQILDSYRIIQSRQKIAC